jgi:uncharacterized membrane protein
MKLLLLIGSIIVFVLVALLCLLGSSWDTLTHLFALVCVGLAFFAASFLPVP